MCSFITHWPTTDIGVWIKVSSFCRNDKNTTSPAISILSVQLNYFIYSVCDCFWTKKYAQLKPVRELAGPASQERISGCKDKRRDVSILGNQSWIGFLEVYHIGNHWEKRIKKDNMSASDQRTSKGIWDLLILKNIITKSQMKTLLKEFFFLKN